MGRKPPYAPDAIFYYIIGSRPRPILFIKMLRCLKGIPRLGMQTENQFRMDWQYWEGVTFSHFLKVVQKLVSLLKPVLNPMFLMDISVDFRRYFAADRRVLIRY